MIESIDTTSVVPPSCKLTDQHVLNCMFSVWYPIFKKYSFPSEIITLSEDFVQFLQEDGVYVAEEKWPKRQKEEDRYDAYEAKWSDEDQEETPPSKSFPELEQKMQVVIESLGGAVFPKFNWSAPKDATWMSSYGNLKCESPGDVILLLKSSDLIGYDIEQAFDRCDVKEISRPQEYTLVLKQWCNVNTAMEFRCFVRDNSLLGISQRDHSNYYPFLAGMKDDLYKKIVSFYSSNIHGKFPDPNYTFDIYVNNKMKVFLVDFNPFGTVTEPLLFEWEELYQISPSQPEFRIITSQNAIRPNVAMASRLPFDLVDMSSTSAISELMDKMKENGEFH